MVAGRPRTLRRLVKHGAGRSIRCAARCLNHNRVVVGCRSGANAQAPQQRPNILFIMGDDIGWFNIGAYHQGIMSGKTPKPDKLASEGMRLNYYARRAAPPDAPISSPASYRSAPDDHGRSGRRRCRLAGASTNHRHGAEVIGLHHRPVRQEPSRRLEQVPPLRPRLR